MGLSQRGRRSLWPATSVNSICNEQNFFETFGDGIWSLGWSFSSVMFVLLAKRDLETSLVLQIRTCSIWHAETRIRWWSKLTFFVNSTSSHNLLWRHYWPHRVIKVPTRWVVTVLIQHFSIPVIRSGHTRSSDADCVSSQSYRVKRIAPDYLTSRCSFGRHHASKLQIWLDLEK